jgi:hypothetical protein
MNNLIEKITIIQRHAKEKIKSLQNYKQNNSNEYFNNLLNST